MLNHEEVAEIYIVKGNGQSLLEYETSVKRDILKISLNINKMSVNTMLYKSKYPNLFERIRKLKN